MISHVDWCVFHHFQRQFSPLPDGPSYLQGPPPPASWPIPWTPAPKRWHHRNDARDGTCGFFRGYRVATMVNIHGQNWTKLLSMVTLSYSWPSFRIWGTIWFFSGSNGIYSREKNNERKQKGLSFRLWVKHGNYLSGCWFSSWKIDDPSSIVEVEHEKMKPTELYFKQWTYLY